MSVELLISPAASGKTCRCIQLIRAQLAKQPFTQVRIILPDRLQTNAFRRRLAEAGGILGAQVGTFGDLYHDLMVRANRPIPVISAAMAHRLVKLGIEHAGLQYYAALRETPGFIQILKDCFAELKRGLVYPEDFVLLAASQRLAQQELARLYTAYQDRLQTLHWADAEGLSWLALETLQGNPELAADLALLVVDGFESFSVVQCETLSLLAKTTTNIFITLPGEYPFKRAAHRRFEAAYHSLSNSLPLAVVNLPRYSLPQNPLRQLEAALFESDAAPIQKPGQTIQMLEARSPAEEAREALRWIKARILRDKVPLHACVVVTPDPALYHPYLNQVSAEFGLSLGFTQRDMLAQMPPVAALLALLDLPVLNYPRRLLLDALRCPYFDLSACGLARRSAEFLDEVCRYGQVIEGREQWDEALKRLEQSPSPEKIEGEEDELPAPCLPRGQQAAVLRQALACFFERLSAPLREQSLSGWIGWLEDLLEEWHYYQPDQNKRDSAAFECLREVLRALVLGEEITGTRRLNYAQFFTELQGALEGSGYQEPLSIAQPALLVMRMKEARGMRFQAAAILGLSEGVFPALERADPFLDEELRESLGLEGRLQREQAGLFYQAVTRAERFLLVTRPYLAEDGEKWEASPYWKAMKLLLPKNSVQTIRPDDPRPLNEAASPEELLFWAVRRRSLPPRFSEDNNLLERWDFLRHASVVLQARQAEQADGPYEGVMPALTEQMQTRYSDQHTWSASRLEAYGACPQRFFIQSALGLEPRSLPQSGLAAAPLGTLLHAGLEAVYRTAKDPSNLQEMLALLPGIAQQIFDEAPQKLGFRPSPLWRREQQQILQLLEMNITRLVEQDCAAGWQPKYYELPFGLEGKPALKIELDGQVVFLHGFIDRVDCNAAGQLRVIDYKTGGSQLSARELLKGQRLQLPLYALAVQDALGLGKVSEGLYWVLKKGAAGALRLSSFGPEEEKGPQAAYAVVRGHLAASLRGIRQAQFPPRPPKEGCPFYCPAAAWCWRFKQGWEG